MRERIHHSTRRLTVGVRPQIAFHHDRDFTCVLQHESAETLPEGTAAHIAHFNISGVEAAASARPDGNITKDKPKVHLTFAMDPSGIVELMKAEATCVGGRPVSTVGASPCAMHSNAPP